MVTECQGDPSCERGTGEGDQSTVSVRTTDASNSIKDYSGNESSSTTTTTSRGIGARKVIAVDVDEVLGHFVLRLCAFHNDRHGTQLTPEHFDSYNFHEVWGGNRAEADEKMRDFFESPHFLEGLPVVDGAEEVLRKHAQDFDLQIVTSRQDILQDHTRQWINTHYAGIFGELHFGNHFSTHGVVRSKPDLCGMIGAVMIIDDNMRYATECAAAGIRTCLFGDYAWNRTSDPLPENVRRTVSWAEVDVELQSILDAGKDGSSTSSNGGGSGDIGSVAAETTPAVAEKEAAQLQRAVREEEAVDGVGGTIDSQNPPAAAQEVDPPPVAAAGPSTAPPARKFPATATRSNSGSVSAVATSDADCSAARGRG
ncbi:unnamed protein product [Scytosiphon promiscuus]